MRQSAGRHVKTAYRIVRDTLVIDLGSVHRVLSSAPRRGGLVKARSILNHQVAAEPVEGVRNHLSERPAGRCAQMVPDPLSPRKWSDPARYLGTLASDLDAKPPCVGLMTAVPMKQLVALREEANGIWVECFSTVGVTNAVRAGEPASFAGSWRRCCAAGTINIILITNANLSVPAMVGAVQVATESKTAVLMDRGVPSRAGHGGATGTGTDAVVIACRLRGGPRIQYSGTHTEIGTMIGRLVRRCVQTGLTRAARWERGNETKG
jgi:iron complex transport system ATP-binding protein